MQPHRGALRAGEVGRMCIPSPASRSVPVSVFRRLYPASSRFIPCHHGICIPAPAFVRCFASQVGCASVAAFPVGQQKAPAIRCHGSPARLDLLSVALATSLFWAVRARNHYFAWCGVLWVWVGWGWGGASPGPTHPRPAPRSPRPPGASSFIKCSLGYFLMLGSSSP